MADSETGRLLWLDYPHDRGAGEWAAFASYRRDDFLKIKEEASTHDQYIWGTETGASFLQSWLILGFLESFTQSSIGEDLVLYTSATNLRYVDTFKAENIFSDLLQRLRTANDDIRIAWVQNASQTVSHYRIFFELTRRPHSSSRNLPEGLAQYAIPDHLFCHAMHLVETFRHAAEELSPLFNHLPVERFESQVLRWLSHDGFMAD